MNTEMIYYRIESYYLAYTVWVGEDWGWSTIELKALSLHPTCFVSKGEMIYYRIESAAASMVLPSLWQPVWWSTIELKAVSRWLDHFFDLIEMIYYRIESYHHPSLIISSSLARWSTIELKGESTHPTSLLSYFRMIYYRIERSGYTQQ